MCTVSWLSSGGRLLFFFNRDELTTREPARPPARATSAGIGFVAPTDGRAGGTWIATTELGSALALLNKSGGRRPESPATRGAIVPALVPARTPRDLVARCRELPLDRFPPFRLAALWREPGAGVAVGWDGASLEVEELDPAIGFLASSGLGDARATAIRGATWNRRLASAKRWSASEHRRFHRGHSPRRGAWSVCVHRPDASTVSYTEIEIDSRAARLTYFDSSPCTASDSTELAIPLRPEAG